jgi:hypothetical protein
VLYNSDGVNRGTEQVAHSGLAQIYALQAVQQEGTQVLPGIGEGRGRW